MPLPRVFGPTCSPAAAASTNKGGATADELQPFSAFGKGNMKFDDRSVGTDELPPKERAAAREMAVFRRSLPAEKPTHRSAEVGELAEPGVGAAAGGEKVR